MSRKHKETYHFTVILFKYVTNSKEVSERLTHFLIVYINISVVHPIICKRLSICTFALCNFVFVMWENQVLTARMNIYRFAKILVHHCTTFNVPTGSAHSPRTFPSRFALFLLFPKCKVHNVLFMFVYVNSCTRLQIFQWLF